jgi:hypothetical protein
VVGAASFLRFIGWTFSRGLVRVKVRVRIKIRIRIRVRIRIRIRDGIFF